MVHVFLWTFVPPYIFPYFRDDTAEMLLIGKHWVLSTWKHPALQCWIVESLCWFTGGVEFTPYLAAQLAVVLTVWCIWKLGQEFLSPRLALVSALVMLTYIYFNYESTLYNNRTFMRAFGALTLYWTWLAFKTNQYRYWIGAGIVSAAGIYCKFTIFILLFSIPIFMLIDSNTRKYWKTPGPWLTLGTALLLFLPLLGWLVQNDFPPLRYAESRISMEDPTFMSHFWCPVHFFIGQILVILLPVLLLVPHLGMFWKWNVSRLWGKELQNRFLTFFVLFPFVLILVIGLLHGGKIRNAHGCFLWIYLPVFLLYTAQNVREDWIACRRSLTLTAFCIPLCAVVFAVSIYYLPMFKGEYSQIHYPGQEIAAEVLRVWDEHFDSPLVYVRGDDVPGGAVVLFSRTNVQNFSPLWSTEEDFRKNGGVLLWHTKNGGKRPTALNHFANLDFKMDVSGEPLPEWLEQFPNRIELPPMEFKAQTKFETPGIILHAVLVPPEKSALEGGA